MSWSSSELLLSGSELGAGDCCVRLSFDSDLESCELRGCRSGKTHGLPTGETCGLG